MLQPSDLLLLVLFVLQGEVEPVLQVLGVLLMVLINFFELSDSLTEEKLAFVDSSILRHLNFLLCSLDSLLHGSLSAKETRCSSTRSIILFNFTSGLFN